jgi:hypothetical protein
VWDDDGGHSGTSEVDERYKSGRRGGTKALASSIYRCSSPARDPGARSGDSLLASARDCELNACGAAQQETRCLTTQGTGNDETASG